MRLTQDDIQNQIKGDVIKYNESIYDGFMPQLFLDYFKKSLMVIPPADHEYKMAAVLKMVKKRPDEVTVVEVGMMINLIYKCPFNQIYDNLEEAIDTTMQFDKIRNEYNEKTSAMNKTLERKYNSLMKLAGLTNNTIPMNSGVIAEA